MNWAPTKTKLKYTAPVAAAILWVGACGSEAPSAATSGSDGASDMGCASGQVYCATCNGGGYCGDGCALIACPTTGDSGSGGSSGGGGSSGAGGSSGGGGERDATSDLDAALPGDASASDASACPPATPDYCVDCNGGGFCVSGGCPGIRCPTRDAGSDAAVQMEAAAGDAGTTACGNCGPNQVCVHPGCGGTLPPCTSDDAGAAACPTGWTYSPSCWNGRGSGPGCSPPPCVPPPPHCADIPSSCASQLTCACFNSANLCNGMACGIVSGRDVMCAAG